mmetsp:Transcript_74176/g.239895  ORF Transcript_74176/g.239895 Transcript_74176/m.239895 type:complete len:305 (+) Transcript_74176:201-1115(+)
MRELLPAWTRRRGLATCSSTAMPAAPWLLPSAILALRRPVTPVNRRQASHCSCRSQTVQEALVRRPWHMECAAVVLAPAPALMPAPVSPRMLAWMQQWMPPQRRPLHRVRWQDVRVAAQRLPGGCQLRRLPELELSRSVPCRSSARWPASRVALSRARAPWGCPVRWAKVAAWPRAPRGASWLRAWLPWRGPARPRLQSFGARWTRRWPSAKSRSSSTGGSEPSRASSSSRLRRRRSAPQASGRPRARWARTSSALAARWSTRCCARVASRRRWVPPARALRRRSAARAASRRSSPPRPAGWHG